MTNPLHYALWAFAAGALIPVMMILNGQLGRAVGSAPPAVVVLFAVGLLSSLLFVLATRPAVPALATWAATPVHLYLGGLIVAFYALSVTILAPRFGVGNTVMFVVLAQLCAAAVIDHWGLLGAQLRPVSLMRLGGLAIILVGVVIAQLAARGNGAAGGN